MFLLMALRQRLMRIEKNQVLKKAAKVVADLLADVRQLERWRRGR
jgi:hypothetical protein